MASGAESIIDLYERHAVAWDTAREARQFIEEQWMIRFESLLTPSGAILDIGCGSGRPIAQHFMERGFDVVGVDSSPTLIGICRERFPSQDWLVADMRTLALNRRFRGIVAWDSLFHLSHEHQRAMFAVFSDHAAPGAALIFTSGAGHGEATGSFAGERLYHASLSLEEYQDLLGAYGFRVIRHEVEDPECGGHTVWLARAHE